MDRTDAPAPRPALADSIAAALDWWREAGVDCAYADAPQRWLSEPEEKEPAALRPTAPAKPLEPERPRIGGDQAGWPRDLAAFGGWWLEEPSLDAAASAATPRLAPRGEAGAALMVLVPMPEEEDRDTLLSGIQGQLIAGMARAIGLPEERLYLASALPRAVTLPDWAALARDGLADVLRHHLGLAAPERLLVLGRDILPLLKHDSAQSPPIVQDISLEGRAISMLPSYAPARLLEHAGLRAGLWRQILDWTDGERR